MFDPLVGVSAVRKLSEANNGIQTSMENGFTPFSPFINDPIEMFPKKCLPEIAILPGSPDNMSCHLSIASFESVLSLKHDRINECFIEQNLMIVKASDPRDHDK